MDRYTAAGHARTLTHGISPSLPSQQELKMQNLSGHPQYKFKRNNSPYNFKPQNAAMDFDCRSPTQERS